jgi:MFS family permease
VSALVAGRLPASHRPVRLAAVGFAVITVGTLSALTVSQLAGIVCAALLIGIGQGITNTSTTHYAMSIAGDGNPASTGAALSLLWNLGSTIGPACVSAVWGGLGYTVAAMNAAFVVAGVFALAGGVMILLASRAAEGPGRRAPVPR